MIDFNMKVKTPFSNLSQGWVYEVNGQRTYMEGISRDGAMYYAKKLNVDWCRPYQRIDKNILGIAA